MPDKKPADKSLPESVRRNRTEAVSGQARAMAGLAFARAGFRDPTLVLRWADIAGPDVARVACPVKLTESASGGILTLKAEPGAAMFLQHESRALCGRINDYLGRTAVTKLRFVQGSLTPRPKPSTYLSTAGTIPVDDPANRFKGPENLKETLFRFASRRRRAD